MLTGDFFLDVATLGGFLVLSVVAYLLLNAMLGDRRKPVTAGVGDVDLADGGPRRAGFFRRAMAGTVPQLGNEIEDIRQDLVRAGHYDGTALVDYLSTRNLFIWMTLALFVALAIAMGGSQLSLILLIVGLVLAALLYGVPRLALRRQAQARVTRIERGLPDALDLVQMCMTGGLTLRDSLKNVSEEIRYTHPDIAVEFDIIRRQADAGSMAKALRNFADRIDAPDIRALASTVTQTERMGTAVAVAVAEFADRLRIQFRQRAEERAGRTSVLLLFPIILCLVPPLLIAIAGPPVLKMRNFILEANQPGGALDTSGLENQDQQQEIGQ